MAAPSSTSLALRGSQGVWFVHGPPSCAPNVEFPSVSSNTCKVMCFSDDGLLFGYADGQSVNVHTTTDFRLVLKVDKPKTTAIAISPRGILVATWEPYTVTKDNPTGSPNLNLWEVKTGRHVRGLFQKKNSDWTPQWSVDEEICGRNVNNEIQFYERNNFEAPVHKLHLQKVAHFKLACKCSAPYHIAAHVPGSKGQPSYVRVYRYPNFGGPPAALANKSFYKADRVEITWNNKGTGLLLLTMSDASSESYYGDQGLHYIGTDGESCLVPRKKNGPVYSVEWSPKSHEFVVVYGFMPAKATLYNTKCEPVFDFGTGPRNIVYYNPQGNVLCLAGFGNLGGNMEFWDPKGQRLISKTEARDTTFFEWSPDGKHLVTATTSPRLRVGNGFKFWDFTGLLLYEEAVPGGEDIYAVSWQSAPPGEYPEPRLPRGGAQACHEPAKTTAYVPPAMRDRPQQPQLSAPRFRQEYEPPSNLKQAQQAPEQMSKAALKNKKKREAKARAKQAEAPGSSGSSEPFVPDDKPFVCEPPPQVNISADNPETDKRLRNLNKKLRQVQQLKEQQASGKELEVNQLEKLKSEASLIAEIKQLQIG